MSDTSELQEGQVAPDFTLPDETGKTVSLKDLQGKLVVLFFYPKDDTPGCTVEACSFRDNTEHLIWSGALIYGISPDNVDSHKKFSTKFSLSFPLLADEGAEVATAYGVWKERNMYGKKFMGVVRTTFLIDGQGNIAKIWHKVKPEGHAEEVLHFIERL
ncbi:MAG: thioredoxin-dependent thiol peroxidase [Chloroflexota bacterium]|nr:thioredoxin-dependent thiol peroxidase [Chloroflexota bacterium]